MTLFDLIHRPIPPEPWAEGEKIPWHEPGFSARMLQEHLSQRHDAASRRAAVIDRHVAWLHGDLLDGAPARVLDLGCGPGLYTSRLARLGHSCVGIDFAPAAIAYARAEAGRLDLDCRYVEADIRTAEIGTDFGLALLIFGELNVFRPEDAAGILAKTRRALAPGGRLVVEAHTLAAVRATGERGPTWSTAQRGLFAERPHLLLEEAFWDDGRQVATERYVVIDGQTGAVERHAASMQGYDEAAYRTLFAAAGFNDIAIHPTLEGQRGTVDPDFLVFVARAGGGA